MKQLIARIEDLRRTLGFSKTGLCKKIGFPFGNYMNITGARGSKPPSDLLMAIVEHVGVNARWLLTGKGPMLSEQKAEAARLRAVVENAETEVGREKAKKEWEAFQERSRAAGLHAGDDGESVLAELAFVPFLENDLAPGHGAAAQGERAKSSLPFRLDWIKGELRRNVEDLVLVEVRGESMVPTLWPGETVLVDRTVTQAETDGLYVLRIGDSLFVKRVQRLADGSIEVSSDNPSYRPFRIGGGEPSGPQAILGRMVWGGRRF